MDQLVQKADKKKTILSICLFLGIFGALVAIASIFDLQISRILTQNNLNEGEYISHGAFPLFFEAVGVSPFYIMIAVAGSIAFWYGFRRENKKMKAVYMFVGAVIVFVALYLLFDDAFKYVGEYVGARLSVDHVSFIGESKELATSLYVKLICGVFAFVVGALLLGTWKNVSAEVNDSLIKFAYMIIATVAFILVIELVKNPVGRVRYRTMNYLGNFDYYTPWYQVNGKRKLFDLEGASADDAKYNFVSDACKSFPSGHTFSAGMCYTLLALPYVNAKFNKKGVKIALWCGTVCLTGVVAIARIVAGAHFMSDVLFGGTIAFVASMITREIFICKGAHFKLFIKSKKDVEEDIVAASSEETIEEETV